jgi:hypothetical protein
MTGGGFESVGRYILGLCAAASVVVLVSAGLGVMSPRGTASQGATSHGRHVALESPAAKEAKQRQAYLEDKIGECHARGGTARLDPLAGYTGCDLPVPKSRSRRAEKQ